MLQRQALNQGNPNDPLRQKTYKDEEARLTAATSSFVLSGAEQASTLEGACSHCVQT